MDHICQECGRPIMTNRRGQPWKYCPACRPIVARRQARDRKRRQRARKKSQPGAL